MKNKNKEKRKIEFIRKERKGYAEYLDSYEPSLTSNPSSSTVNNLPLNSLTSDKSEDKDATSFSALGGNKEVLRKSESRETIIVFSLFAKKLICRWRCL